MRIAIVEEKGSTGANGAAQQFVPALRAELESWPDVHVVDAIASRDTIGETVRVGAVSIGDSVRIRIDAQSGSSHQSRAIVQMVDAKRLPQSVAVIAREVLAGAESNAAPGYGELSDRSVKALRAYVAGHAALRRGELDSAAGLFQEAIGASPSFCARAVVEGAGGGSGLHHSDIESWKSFAGAAMKNAGTLGIGFALCNRAASAGKIRFS